MKGPGDIPNLAPKNALYPETAIAIARNEPSYEGDDFDEAIYVARAVASRQNEFLVGRHLARQCLLALNRKPCAIPRNNNRHPVWPSGVVGSISHCKHLIVALTSTHLDAVGIDVQCTRQVTQGVRSIISTGSEDKSDKGFEGALTGQETALRFSAKESVFKAIFPTIRRPVEFQEVEICLDATRRRFRSSYVGNHADGELVGNIEGHFSCAGDHVLTLAILARG